MVHSGNNAGRGLNALLARGGQPALPPARAGQPQQAEQAAHDDSVLVFVPPRCPIQSLVKRWASSIINSLGGPESNSISAAAK